MFCINCPNYANIIFSMFGLLKSKKANTILLLKVKNDHRSKFSNLSNWKEEA